MKLWFRRLCVLLYCILIFILSSQAHLPRLLEPENADKFVHFIEYGVLAFLFYRMILLERLFFLRSRPFILSWFFTASYGFSDEIHQYFVPHRSCSLMDWLADAAGAAIVLGVMAIRMNQFKMQKSKCKMTDQNLK
ncbi:MAG: VanZ family protein [Chlamydiae bacterium]|nr:VanZ family protein [Chlamydiota bacterium]MBI3278156.1 VanZ family protein [Chlamydiota bacterium]